MLNGNYWFRSKMYDTEEVIDESMNCIGFIWSGIDKKLWVILIGFNAQPLDRILESYHLLEKVKPCSI